MEIIAHRGYWKTEAEKNTLPAFERALTNGFGIETDVRDFSEELVISHNMPTKECFKLEELFELYTKNNSKEFIFLNIKADGLQFELNRLIKYYKIKNYYIFDMSIPDAVISLLYDLQLFTRLSEYEKVPLLIDDSAGIWLDSFIDEKWYDMSLLDEYLKLNKKICIVSPELHKRDKDYLWEKIMGINFKSDNIMLCTDLPKLAREYFYEK